MIVSQGLTRDVVHGSGRRSTGVSGAEFDGLPFDEESLAAEIDAGGGAALRLKLDDVLFEIDMNRSNQCVIAFFPH